MPDEEYEGLKNKEILEEYYDDNVYEASDLSSVIDEVSLEFEADNPYDPNVIKVTTEDMEHIGYVPKDDIEKVTDIIKTQKYYVSYEIIGSKYKYVDQNEDKEKIGKDYYGVEVEISYE